VSACAYKYLPKVTLNAENLANPAEVIQICPADVFSSDPSERVVVRDEMACTLCMDCVGKAVPSDPKRAFPVKVEGDESSYVFYVESTGSIPPKRILQEASNIINRKATTLEDMLKKGLDH
jgi:DNA-directed RNA polymerase subunit D